MRSPARHKNNQEGHVGDEIGNGDEKLRRAHPGGGGEGGSSDGHGRAQGVAGGNRSAQRRVGQRICRLAQLRRAPACPTRCRLPAPVAIFPLGAVEFAEEKEEVRQAHQHAQCADAQGYADDVNDAPEDKLDHLVWGEGGGGRCHSAGHCSQRSAAAVSVSNSVQRTFPMNSQSTVSEARMARNTTRRHSTTGDPMAAGAQGSSRRQRGGRRGEKKKLTPSPAATGRGMSQRRRTSQPAGAEGCWAAVCAQPRSRVEVLGTARRCGRGQSAEGAAAAGADPVSDSQDLLISGLLLSHRCAPLASGACHTFSPRLRVVSKRDFPGGLRGRRRMCRRQNHVLLSNNATAPVAEVTVGGGSTPTPTPTTRAHPPIPTDVSPLFATRNCHRQCGGQLQQSAAPRRSWRHHQWRP